MDIDQEIILEICKIWYNKRAAFNKRVELVLDRALESLEQEIEKRDARFRHL